MPLMYTLLKKRLSTAERHIILNKIVIAIPSLKTKGNVYLKKVCSPALKIFQTESYLDGKKKNIEMITGYIARAPGKRP